MTTTLVHVPKTSRGGCADAYRVQFSPAAGMVVWCNAPDSATEVVSSHGTTYQLRFVGVPETTIVVGQQRGEPLSIEIEHGPGNTVVRRLSRRPQLRRPDL